MTAVHKAELYIDIYVRIRYLLHVEHSSIINLLYTDVWIIYKFCSYTRKKYVYMQAQARK